MALSHGSSDRTDHRLNPMHSALERRILSKRLPSSTEAVLGPRSVAWLWLLLAERVSDPVTAQNLLGA